MKVRIDSQLAEALRSILKTEAGRRFVEWLIFDECKLAEGSFHTNALVNAHLTGRQAVGKELFHLVRVVDPEALTVLFRERILNQNISTASSEWETLEESIRKGLYDAD